MNRCPDCKYSFKTFPESSYVYCTHPKVGANEARFLAGTMHGVLAEYERDKRFFGACGRQGKLWEAV